MSGPASDRAGGGLSQPPVLNSSASNANNPLGGDVVLNNLATNLFPQPPPLMSSLQQQSSGMMPDPRLWSNMTPQMAAAAAAAAAASGNPAAVAAFGALMAHHQQQQQQQHLMPPVSQAAAAAAAAMMPPPSNFNPYQMQIAQMLVARGLNPFAAMHMLANASGNGAPGNVGGLFGQMPAMGGNGLPFGGNNGAAGMMPFPPPSLHNTVNNSMVPTQQNLQQPQLPLLPATSAALTTSTATTNSGLNSLVSNSNAGVGFPPPPLRHPGLPGSMIPQQQSQFPGSAVPSATDFSSMAAAMAAAANNLNPMFRMPNISAAAASAAMAMAANSNAAAANNAAAFNNIPPAFRENFNLFLNNRFANASNMLQQQQHQQQQQQLQAPLYGMAGALPPPFGNVTTSASSFGGAQGPMGGPASMLPGNGMMPGAAGINPLLMFQDAAAAAAMAANVAAKTKKPGKWNAMHVRIAWEIHSHQKKNAELAALASAGQAAAAASASGASGLPQNVAAMSMFLAAQQQQQLQKNTLPASSSSSVPSASSSSTSNSNAIKATLAAKIEADAKAEWRRDNGRSPAPSAALVTPPHLSSMASILAGNNSKNTSASNRKSIGDLSNDSKAKRDSSESDIVTASKTSSSHLSNLLKSVKSQPMGSNADGLPNKISSGGVGSLPASSDDPAALLSKNFMANFLRNEQRGVIQQPGAEMPPLDTSIIPTGARPPDLLATSSANTAANAVPFYMQQPAWLKMFQDTLGQSSSNSSGVNKNEPPSSLLSLANAAAAAAMAAGGDALVPPATSSSGGPSTSNAAAAAAQAAMNAASQLMAHLAASVNNGGAAVPPIVPHNLLQNSASSSSSASTVQSATPPPDITFSLNSLRTQNQQSSSRSSITPTSGGTVVGGNVRSGGTSPETTISTPSVRAPPKSRRSGGSSRRKKAAVKIDTNDVDVDKINIDDAESKSSESATITTDNNKASNSSSSSSTASSSRRRVSKRQRELRLEATDEALTPAAASTSSGKADKNGKSGNSKSAPAKKTKRRRKDSVSSSSSASVPTRSQAEAQAAHEINQKPSLKYAAGKHDDGSRTSTPWENSPTQATLSRDGKELSPIDSHGNAEAEQSSTAVAKRRNSENHSSSSSSAASSASSKALLLSSANNNGHHHNNNSSDSREKLHKNAVAGGVQPTSSGNSPVNIVDVEEI